MKRRERTKTKNPTEKSPTQEVIKKSSEPGSKKQIDDKNAEYDNEGRPNNPF